MSIAFQMDTESRRFRIMRLRRENTRTINLGRGNWRVELILDHQSFQLGSGGGVVFESQKRAFWYATQLAIALNRFKFGD